LDVVNDNDLEQSCPKIRVSIKEKVVKKLTLWLKIIRNEKEGLGLNNLFLKP